MIIDCISDLHGHFPELEGGDLLIVAGDLTAHDTRECHEKFGLWLLKQGKKYKKAIVIAGNHDNFCERYNQEMKSWGLGYLCDSGTEFEGLRIWGSPWTKSFEGMNPHCKAFTLDTEEELAEKWAMIPEDVDILVTHSPPYGMQDYRPLTQEEKRRNLSDGYGSKSLIKRICQMSELDGKRRLLVCGHIHEGYGRMLLSDPKWDKCTWRVVNASYVNELYQPINKPIRIVL